MISELKEGMIGHKDSLDSYKSSHLGYDTFHNLLKPLAFFRDDEKFPNKGETKPQSFDGQKRRRFKDYLKDQSTLFLKGKCR